MVNDYIPGYGDIVWVVIEPRVGHEQSGRRPALVISPRELAEHTNLVVICPITSRAKGLPFEVPLSATKMSGAVLPIHVKSVDWQARKVKFIETAPRSVTRRVARSVAAMIGIES